MPLYIDPRRNSTFGIGICDRCKRKFPLHMLGSDRNNPGLKVCEADNDEFDPYRLPRPGRDHVTLPFTRPDEPIVVPPSDD